jgi:hypothetical protein
MNRRVKLFVGWECRCVFDDKVFAEENLIRMLTTALS